MMVEFLCDMLLACGSACLLAIAYQSVTYARIDKRESDLRLYRELSKGDGDD